MTSKQKLKKYKKILKDSSKNYWAISTVVLAILLIITLVSGGVSCAVISPEEAGQKVLDFANEQGANAELLSTANGESLYEIVLSISGQPAPVYVTKDGKFLIPQPIPLTGQVTAPTPVQEPIQETSKSDKPEVELFIMTHCPYGTQAEKGFVPLLESFDKADMKIRFVHYFMHEPEKTETPRQICIREEQSDKFLPYLREFLKEGSYENAIVAANIDKTKMNKCTSSDKWEEYYNIDKTLSESYGVRGSPTLVVNGIISQSGRDSTSYLSVACSAFNSAPEECGTLTLSSTAPSPMWGWDASGNNNQAQC